MKIAPRSIGGQGRGMGDKSRQGRQSSFVPGGTCHASPFAPTDESVGYFLLLFPGGRKDGGEGEGGDKRKRKRRERKVTPGVFWLGLVSAHRRLGHDGRDGAAPGAD